jgi:hypothetical protein
VKIFDKSIRLLHNLFDFRFCRPLAFLVLLVLFVQINHSLFVQMFHAAKEALVELSVLFTIHILGLFMVTLNVLEFFYFFSINIGLNGNV